MVDPFFWLDGWIRRGFIFSNSTNYHLFVFISWWVFKNDAIERQHRLDQKKKGNKWVFKFENHKF